MRLKFLAILIFVLGLLPVMSVFAQDKCMSDPSNWNEEEVKTCLDEIKQESASLQASIEPNEVKIRDLEARIKALQKSIDSSVVKMKKLEEDVKVRSDQVSTSYAVMSVKTREMYKRLRSEPLWVELLRYQQLGVVRRELAYRQESSDKDKQIIVNLVSEIGRLEVDKKKVENEKIRLTSLQSVLDKENGSLQKVVKEAKAYQNVLSNQISALSARQQAILAARSGSFVTGVGSVPIGSDYDGSIAGFNENAPGGSFAVFSFGAYTHRKGMSQYGAKARAGEGQSFEQILETYYGKKPVDKDTGGDIIVNGNSMNFEERYLMGIAEMPSDWPENALKAQAVAARTYAYRYKQEGKSICTTEACQVFSSSKADNPPEAWKNAVQSTRGKVLEDVVTYYSSTTGGFLTTLGWDTTDRSGDGDWTTRAWESKAGSPWFYKAWYRNGYKNSDSSCDRKPWMTEEEMADIINSWLVLKRGEGSGVDTGRILPVTISRCSIGGQGGDPYSMSDLRSKLSNPVTSISGKPTVAHDSSGNTTNVRFNTNRGELSISGSEFKEVFNTRAPGYVSIPQKGFAFFNIEKK